MTRQVMAAQDLTEAAALSETPNVEGAYPRLSRAQLDELKAYGER